jgi:TRAP-type transport system large permease protein
MFLGLLLFIILIILLLIGLPVAIALGVISLSWILLEGRSLLMVASKMYAQMNQFTLLAIPFFILAGEIMNYSGITNRLVKFVNIIIGRVRGGLAQVNIYTSMLFAGITGAAISDVAALGAIFIPAMEEQGYTREYSAMITAASSIVGPIIPPSIIIVLYGAVTRVSIGAMFAGAIIPGVIVSVAMSIMVGITGKKKNLPKIEEKFTFKELITSFKDSFLALMMPVIILGGILSGVFTPTEAAAVALLYALIVSVFIFRSITWDKFILAMKNSVRVSAALLFIMGVSGILGWIISRINLPGELTTYMLSLSSNPNVICLIVVALLLFVGTWLDNGAACILMAPILAPIMENIGFHPVHFGIIMIVTLNVGLITPPLGVCLFAAVEVGKVPFESIVQEIWPYIILDVIVVLLLVYIPELTLFFPRLFGLIY